MYYMKKILGLSEDKSLSDFSEFNNFSAQGNLYRVIKDERSLM